MAASSMQILIEAIDRASGPIAKIGSAMTEFGDRTINIGNQLTDAITKPVMGMAQEAIGFETSMAEVQKAANLDPAGMQEMSAQILEMTRTIPMAAGEIAEITAAGARLGVSGSDNLGQFTEMISEMSVAFDMAAGDAADNAAKIANVFNLKNADGGLDFGAIEQYGDAVNNLADNMATTESQIITTTKAMAGIASNMGITATETASLGAAFTALGVEPGVAANAFKVAMQRMGDGTGEIGEGMRALGIDVEAFQKQVSSGDGAQAFVSAMEAINSSTLGPIEKAQALSDVFGNNYNDTIAQAASGSQSFTDALGLMEESLAGNGATMADSFGVMSETTAAQMQIAKNALSEVGITLGSVLLPAINDILSAVTPLIQKFAEFARANPAIAQIAVGFLAVAAAVGPLLIAIGSVVGAVGSIATAWGAASAAFAAGGVFAAATPVITGLATAFVSLLGAIAGVVGFAASLALIPAAIFKMGAAASGVDIAFSEMPGIIGGALQESASRVEEVGPAISSMFTSYSNIAKLKMTEMKNSVVNGISGLAAGVGARLASFGATISGFIGNIIGLVMMRVAVIRMQITAAITGIVTAISGRIAAIAGLIGQIVAAIGFRIAVIRLMVTTTVQNIITSVQTAITNVVTTITTGMTNFVTAIVTGVTNAVTKFSEFGGQAVAAVQGVGEQLFSAGAEIVGRLAEGIMSSIGKVTDAMGKVASAAGNLWPHSPVKEGPLTILNNTKTNPGAKMVEMLAGGISSSNALSSAMSTAIPGFGGGGMSRMMPQASTASGGNITLNYSPTINGASGQSVEQTLQLHVQELRTMLARLQHEERRVAY